MLGFGATRGRDIHHSHAEHTHTDTDTLWNGGNTEVGRTESKVEFYKILRDENKDALLGARFHSECAVSCANGGVVSHEVRSMLEAQVFQPSSPNQHEI